MIVPFTRGQAAQQPQGPQPSETDMLMALAAMHSMGRIAQADGPRSDAWQSGNWNTTWKEAIPFGKGTENETPKDAMKKVPEGHESIQEGNFIWTRPKQKGSPKLEDLTS